MPRKMKCTSALTLRVYQDAHGFLPQHLVKHAHSVNYLQHTLIMQRAWRRDRKARKSGWVPLMADFLRNTIGRAAMDKAIPWLIESHYLERGTVYRPGSKARLHRAGRWLRSSAVSSIVCTDGPLSRRLAKTYANLDRSLTPAERHLKDWLRHCTIDVEAALEHLETLNLSPRSYECCVETVLAIQRGEWDSARCSRFGRFDSPATRLKRELRQYLRLDNEPLVEIDIANAQPLLLVMTARQALQRATFWRIAKACTFNCSLVDPDQVPTVPFASGLPTIAFRVPASEPGSLLALRQGQSPRDIPPPAAPWREQPPKGTVAVTPAVAGVPSPYDGKKVHRRKVFEHLYSIAKGRVTIMQGDVAYFLQLCESGKLYDFLIAETAWKGTKQQWKDASWFAFLYGPNRRKEYLEQPGNLELLRLHQAFKKHFPTLFRWMCRWRKNVTVHANIRACDLRNRKPVGTT